MDRVDGVGGSPRQGGGRKAEEAPFQRGQRWGVCPLVPGPSLESSEENLRVLESSVAASWALQMVASVPCSLQTGVLCTADFRLYLPLLQAGL